MESLTATLRATRRRLAMDEIAGVAQELFMAKGYAEVSVDEIAQKAGCSPRTFYRYFGSKEDAMFYELSEMLEELIHRLDEHLDAGEGPWAAVTNAMATLIESFGSSSQRMAAGRMKLWLSEGVLRAKYMQYVADTEAAILRALLRVANGDQRQERLAPLRSVCAVGVYRSVLLEHHEQSDGMALAQYLREGCAQIAAGLRD